MEVLFLIWLVCACLAAVVAQSKGGNVVLYAFLGFLLGPIGIILACVAKGEEE